MTTYTADDAKIEVTSHIVIGGMNYVDKFTRKIKRAARKGKIYVDIKLIQSRCIRKIKYAVGVLKSRGFEVFVHEGDTLNPSHKVSIYWK